MATEVELLERAKVYMEKLANGIDPISDTEVRDDDCINNVRLSRCFFYVADVLGKVIENGGTVTARKKPGTIPFAITDEQLVNYEFSDNPIALSEIAKRINALVNGENMKKLTYNHLADWLMSIDMLEYATKGDGSMTKHPTEAGKRMGIGVEKRQGMRGEYLTVVYNKQAQHFIVDNMDAVLDSVNKK
ncbi:MAG: hypothetical protein IJ435_03505 [Clostridia bacterium]|nr:hypothetical protein [Clostridia bacterium]